MQPALVGPEVRLRLAQVLATHRPDWPMTPNKRGAYGLDRCVWYSLGCPSSICDCWGRLISILLTEMDMRSLAYSFDQCGAHCDGPFPKTG